MILLRLSLTIMQKRKVLKIDLHLCEALFLLKEEKEQNPCNMEIGGGEWWLVSEKPYVRNKRFETSVFVKF